MKTWLTWGAFALAMAAAIFVLAWPVYASSDSNGNVVARKTLAEVNGMSVLIPVFFPVVLTVLPLLYRNQVVRIVAVVLMGLFNFLGGMTIGLFYLPAAILLLLAACASDSAKISDALP